NALERHYGGNLHRMSAAALVAELHDVALQLDRMAYNAQSACKKAIQPTVLAHNATQSSSTERTARTMARTPEQKKNRTPAEQRAVDLFRKGHNVREVLAALKAEGFRI